MGILKDKEKPKYYRLNNILAKNARYNMIIGERSNGKSFAPLEKIIEDYAKTGAQGALIRRYDMDLRGQRGDTVFANQVNAGLVTKYTKGEWDSITRFSGRWYFCRGTGKDRVVSDDPICYSFALSNMEHDKSSSFPRVKNILFDEFISRDYYYPDEFVIFCNVLSTIIRERDDVTIFMCGNTINKHCPYFSEMGLKHIKEMKPGDIDVYDYGDTGLRVAVEFADSISKKGKKSDVYFAFDNPRLHMITGKGDVWEIGTYPRKPVDFAPKEVLFTYFILFDGELLQCEVVLHEDLYFTYIHRKTTPIKAPKKDLIYSTEYNSQSNYRRRITAPQTALEGKLLTFYKRDKVFYQDNEIGEIVRNYLNWCIQGA